jgi:lipid-binding SYLF domain-containing protein
MKTLQYLTLSAVIALAMLVSAQADEAKENEKLAKDVQSALSALTSKDSSFEKTLKKVQGYVVFPRIAKGGLIIGGAGGAGEVYEGGKLIGRAKLSQGTIGAQIGGQVFTEVILFDSKEALDRFKQSVWEMNAQVGAVAAAEGVAQNAKFSGGVAIITMPVSGLMAEASVGGQKLTFIPLEKK